MFYRHLMPAVHPRKIKVYWDFYVLILRVGLINNSNNNKKETLFLLDVLFICTEKIGKTREYT